MSGRDTLMTSMTGSGKTLAFLVPLLMKHILPYAKEDFTKNHKPNQWIYSKPKILIVAPGRELALQVAGVVNDLLRPYKNLHVAALVGGANHKRQDNRLKNAQPLVVV